MIRSAITLLFLFIITATFSQRIITAGSAMTETVCALGDCEKIVASDKTSLYPSQIQTLPSIGYRTGIQAEGIISMKPTLFIAEKEYVSDAVLEQVKSAGIKVLVIERNYSLDGTKNLIREIAGGLNRKAEGETLIAGIEADITTATSWIKKSKLSPRVLCVYNRGTSSFDAGGTRTFAEILPYVGAKTAVTGINGYKPLNAEAMIAADPDYMLFFETGLKSIGGVDGVLAVPGVLQTKAGKAKQIIALDGIKLSNFGPRFGEAVKELSILLHPDVKPN